MSIEQDRLQEPAWRHWGPYVSDRQWGTVREDYSINGDAWNYTTHDMARSYSYRWGEEGIAGFCDHKQSLCLALALWNGQDPILKERYFGLGNNEGNHGEDVKELYFYQDALPSHAYQRMLYKYPQNAYPYDRLVEENRRRSRLEPEFEILDTGIFDDNQYFDVFVEYAKGSPHDILMKVTIWNRGSEEAKLHILPTIWFSNTWRWGYDRGQSQKPTLKIQAEGRVLANHSELGQYVIQAEGEPEWLFCDNDSNTKRLYNQDTNILYPKDGINDSLLHGADSVNPAREGTKAAAHYQVDIPAGGSQSIRLRMWTGADHPQPFADFDTIIEQRVAEADAFYQTIHPGEASSDEKNIQRQALGGMLWNKQFYYYDIHEWLKGDPAGSVSAAERMAGRNHEWRHLMNKAVISMPDKWEYPWYAAWDWAFHCLILARIDPDFAKHQLVLLTNEWYIHPNGQLPAYEWALGDVNPPVHAWVVWRIYQKEQEKTGKRDTAFLESVFHKLLLNFTWWVNREDATGDNIFEGGFLGLDNIGVFDRNAVLPEGGHLEQSDGTSWMAMYALNMMRMALELAQTDSIYDDLATKFFDHFLYIAQSMTQIAETGLWDEQDGFFYDQLRTPNGEVTKLRVKTLVGLIPLFVVETFNIEELQKRPTFLARIRWFWQHRPDLANQVSRYIEPNDEDVSRSSKRLFSLLRGYRLKALLHKMLDEGEFLSPHGIRSVSQAYRDQPYEFAMSDTVFRLNYTPAESDSGLFGGNSNWRGPVWIPVNYLLIESLQEFYAYFGDQFTVECPVGSARMLTLKEVADELTNRLIAIFQKTEDNKRIGFGLHTKWQDEHFRDNLQFYEYFHGDTGWGLGASHQTGWTGLISELIHRKYTAVK
ncbi:MAG: glucosidase [Siphonobacter sp.]